MQNGSIAGVYQDAANTPAQRRKAPGAGWRRGPAGPAACGQRKSVSQSFADSVPASTSFWSSVMLALTSSITASLA